MSWFKRGASNDDGTATTPNWTPPEPSTTPTPENKLMFQAFEWHTASTPPAPNETHSRESHWSRLGRILPELAELGVTSVWLPPGCKANNPQGNGYDCYDLWDLGEFDQKWTRSTKWGSRQELSDLVETAQRCGGVELIWDAVLNHKTAGDATDEAWAVEVDREDRRIEISAPRKIEAWLKYDFPGREREGMKYSSLKWRAEHFNGTDWDQRAKKNALYKLIDDPATYPKPNKEQIPIANKPTQGFNRLARFAGTVSNAISDRVAPPRRPGKGWAEDVDKTHGNYDYLIFSNIFYAHPDVQKDVLRWGQWMIQDTGVHGFRLDAAQHFSWNFIRNWITQVQVASRNRYGKDAMIVGEVWAAEVSRQLRWLDFVTPPGSPVLACAFDSPLLYSFSRISEDVRKGSKNADLRTLLSGPGHPDKHALVSVRPHQAVTFVTNHDTQPGQTSFTPVDASLKSLFYAFILLRREGHPCVFWGDLYGTRGKNTEAPACQATVLSSGMPDSLQPQNSTRSLLPSLMLARKLFAYGQQKDYFDSMSCIGWNRSGTHDRPGCVVIMSIGPPSKWTIKKMAAGRPGEKWVDILSEKEGRPEIVIDNKGFGVFACKGRSVSVYVNEQCEGAARFPVPFEHDVYRQ
ncbi:related to glucan 1,4-alpha-maltohexaosidase precursor [Lecanosticta acicola]|uniref:Related to glucan 1,4-alpha-maltohexaosidase n=1 Tax=Lecanosticta acicola TaxID=111012 RepID=A0AAI8YRY4_9PEZI|nr:related to glucan 1,4-alpha-maltohexaosidase precursor [Lecanosticta acicola]